MDISKEVTFYEWRDVPEGDYAVLGDPIGHSLSPRMHSAAYDALGLDLVYSAVRVPYGEFFEAMDRLRALGYKGVNCTVPLKELAFDWCPSFLGLAGELGSVNTINLVTQQGTNTDLPGFLKVCEEFGVGSGARVLILGAGGT
ncbi:MAG: shikimate dehydrogenase family protein, partial [Fimbriimonadaceae bacterium]